MLENFKSEGEGRVLLYIWSRMQMFHKIFSRNGYRLHVKSIVRVDYVIFWHQKSMGWKEKAELPCSISKEDSLQNGYKAEQQSSIDLSRSYYFSKESIWQCNLLVGNIHIKVHFLPLCSSDLDLNSCGRKRMTIYSSDGWLLLWLWYWKLSYFSWET